MVGVFDEQDKVKCRWRVQKGRLGRLGTWLGRVRLIILVSLDCMLIEIKKFQRVFIGEGWDLLLKGLLGPICRRKKW